MSDSGDLRPRRAGFVSEFKRLRKKLRSNWLAAFVIDFLVIVGSALVLSVLIKAFLIRSFYIPSGSMLETLQINDRIIVNAMAPELMPIEHGDIVVFRDPGGWLGAIQTVEKDSIQELTDFVLGTFGITAPDSAEHLVKRVIGLPGDTVECCDPQGRLIVNGVPIDEPYIAPGANPSDVEFKVTIPEGSYWVMGDNRGNSTDSRFHQDLPSKGFVDESFIVGKAFVISWPVSNFKWLDNHPEVFSDVPKP